MVVLPVAFDNIERLDVITIFVRAAVDPVGREDRSESLASEDYVKDTGANYFPETAHKEF